MSQKSTNPNINMYAGENLVFMHLPKTAGTTIHDILVEKFRSPEVCPERFNAIRKYSIFELNQYRYFSGHYNRDAVDFIPGPKRVFTFLRDPKKRILSLYYFWKGHTMEHVEKAKLGGPRLAKTLPLLDFLRSNDKVIARNFDNYMVRALCGASFTYRDAGYRFDDAEFAAATALEYLKRLYFVGTQESFDEDAKRLLQMIGIQHEGGFGKARDFHKFSETINMEHVEREEITEEIDAELNKLTEADYILYNYYLNNRSEFNNPYPM